MAVAVSYKIDPVTTVVEDLQRALDRRAHGLQWRPTAQGLAADVLEGTLLLTQLSGTSAWKLTAAFQGKPTADGPEAASTERGRRVIGWGALGRMQQRAHELAMRGVPGGPAYVGGDLSWYAIEHDQSLRMAVPDGELCISPLEGDLWALTHEDVHGVTFLDCGVRSELMNQAVPLCLTRGARPLQIRMNGSRVNLRSIGVPGVLGYHALRSGALVILALVEGHILLLEARGVFHRVLARLFWTDLQFGEPVEVRHARGEARIGDGPSPAMRVLSGGVRTAELATAVTEAAVAEPAAQDGPAASSQSSIAPDDPTVHAPMNERHRALCQRYFRRLHQQLRGPGARKARAIVLLLVERLERCREDITGPRTEVHAQLALLLGRPLPGGSRNARDCLDLLMHSSLFARPGPDKQCTLLFGQLHDPDSELMRLIAAEDEREQRAANEPPTEPRSSDAASEDEVAHEAFEPAEGPSVPTERSVPSPLYVPEPPLASGAVADPEVEVQHQLEHDSQRESAEIYRHLGKAMQAPLAPPAPPEPPGRTPELPPCAPPPSPPITATPTGHSSRKERRLTSTQSTFLGQIVDDDDKGVPLPYDRDSSQSSTPFMDLPLSSDTVIMPWQSK